jgi:hypothetical protein
MKLVKKNEYFLAWQMKCAYLWLWKNNRPTSIQCAIFAGIVLITVAFKTLPIIG